MNPNLHKTSWTEEDELILFEGPPLFIHIVGRHLTRYVGVEKCRRRSGGVSWVQISGLFANPRPDIAARYRYLKVSKQFQRRPWNKEEDRLLRKVRLFAASLRNYFGGGTPRSRIGAVRRGTWRRQVARGGEADAGGGALARNRHLLQAAVRCPAQRSCARADRQPEGGRWAKLQTQARKLQEKRPRGSEEGGKDPLKLLAKKARLEESEAPLPVSASSTDPPAPSPATAGAASAPPTDVNGDEKEPAPVPALPDSQPTPQDA